MEKYQYICETNLQKGLNISWDRKTDYANNFEIEGKKVTKINPDRSWYQITSVEPLPKQRCSLTFRLEKYGEKGSYITMGILTEQIKQNKDSEQEHTVYYVSSKKYKQGHMHVDNQLVQNKRRQFFLEQGENVKMSLDLSKGWICFETPRCKVAHPLLMNHWKQQNVYVFVQVFEKGGSVSVIE